MAEPISFDGQVVIVTGAGRGLGRGYCLDLARRGAAVVVNDLDAAAADEVVAEIGAAGGTAVASPDSVATPDGGRAVVDRALEAFGTVDAVVNNAGFLRNGYFEELTLDRIDAILDVHVRGAFFVTQPAWTVMRAKGYGRVILTSSASGMFGLRGQANYCAAKAAAHGLCRGLAIEGEACGILVNAVVPMALGTTTIAEGHPLPGWDEDADFEARAVLDGREGVDTVVPLVTFLASRTCTVSGEMFSAVGGRYARVFVGVAPGWLAADVHCVTAEDIVRHLEAIRQLDGFSVPGSLHDEVKAVAAAVADRV
jgi:NAD(P)-dependent dehydrogenase (short-subunit alcohol dehydrogenase family)